MEKKQTVVFDLDGTVYQNTVFHRDYIHFMVQGTLFSEWEKALVAFAEQVYAGRRMHMNRFYAVQTLAPSTPEQFFEQLEHCLCPPLSFRSALREQGLMYLGDAWAVVTFMGKALGVLEGARGDEVFFQTRRKMERDGIVGYPQLTQAIRALGQRCNVVLLSNSYQSTVEEFLRQIGMEETFPIVCYSSNKPFEMIQNLKAVAPYAVEHPQTLISIGDNAFNDLMPVEELGGRTVWINPYPNIERPRCDVELRTLQDLCQYLACL